MYNKYHPARLSTGDNLNGNVYIHPTAKVDPSAKIGPHVAIGANVVVHEGSYSPSQVPDRFAWSVDPLLSLTPQNQLNYFKVPELKTQWSWMELS